MGRALKALLSCLVHVAHLSLQDFRSYPTAEVALERGVTAFVGPNGQGKTNLVEAIGYVASHASHRAATDAPLVRHGAPRAIVRAGVVKDDRKALIELEINPGKANRARLNRSPVPRPREILGMLRTVLFAPEDLSLVKGDPGERRRFMDELLTARAPCFAGVSPLVARAYAALAPHSGAADLIYRSSLGDVELSTDRGQLAEQLMKAVAESRKQELERGVSLVGPHRDELVLRLGELPARGYASHGESWSFALGLRLAAFDLLRADGDDPVLILDDVFAELGSSSRPPSPRTSRPN